jgi:hypothetical protein
VKRELTISGDRQTGKTHQMLRMAIDAARSGRRVLYICQSKIMARHALNRAEVMIDLDSLKSVRRSIGNLRIETFSGGFITFNTGKSPAGRAVTADDLFLDDPEFYAGNVAALIITTASRADATITRSELTR